MAEYTSPLQSLNNIQLLVGAITGFYGVRGEFSDLRELQKSAHDRTPQSKRDQIKSDLGKLYTIALFCEQNKLFEIFNTAVKVLPKKSQRAK